MDINDPTLQELDGLNAVERDWSVEDTAAMQAFDTMEEGVDNGEKAAEQPGGLDVPRIPIPPVLPILPKRNVSGRYRSGGLGFQLELRVDVDGTGPMMRLSGDFYMVNAATITYFGSFVVNAVTLSVTASLVTIEGIGSYTYGTAFPKIRVTIPRVLIIQPLAPATVRFFSLTNVPGAVYVCSYQSVYFRTVVWEQDREQGVTPFVSYNTGSLPSGGPARTLTVPSAYAEAGIQFLVSGGTDIVPTAETGTNLKWNNSELHAAMVRHFSLWQDIPQWKVWLIAAYAHEMGSGLYGIMFDQQGRQRQGCATFHQGIGGTSADKLRLQLYCYVHELGHCFNLFHSWQKSYMTPPMPNRPSALSWMNYPWNYPGGATAFWNAFAFRFDNLEIIHLRHALRNNIIIGGNPFGTGAALENAENFTDPIEENSGLKLELEAPKNFGLGEPVVVEIKLRTTDMRGKRVHANLHPNLGFVTLGIQKPGGQVVVYEPLLEHCMIPEMVKLDADRPSIYESAYIGYGKDGFYFDQGGFYRLRAIYNAPDGSQVFSNTLKIRVRNPLNSDDEEVADLFFGEEQGSLLYLLGSDSEFLKKGNDAFDLVLDKYGKHPMAVYARLVKGMNAGRAFKDITEDKRITVRKPQLEDSIKLLSAVSTSSEAGKGVDNITLNMTMRSLAKAQKMKGDDEGAKKTMDHMVDFFKKKSLKPHVLNLIKEQAKMV